MPFSFKPDEAQGNAQAAPTASQSTFASSATNLMERAKSEGKSIAEIFLFAVFGFAALTLFALFVYKFYLTSQVEAKREKLSAYDTKLAGLPLEDMRKVSNRLKVVNQLVKEHPSVNVAFMILEASIENFVTYNKFDLRYSDTLKSYQLILGGIAPDYKSVAQQMDTYKRKPYSTYVQKISVEGLQPDLNGRIAFSFTMPISIMGKIPETFSIVDGTATTTFSRTPMTQESAKSEEGLGSASSTSQLLVP